MSDLKGKPISCVEIGSYEGRSTIWWLDNLLTHDSSRIIVIDPYTNRDHQYRRFLHNLSLHPRLLQASLIRARSRQVIQSIPDSSLDFVYVDGSHEAIDIMGDAVLLWYKMKPGGIMLFDDYLWENPRGGPCPKVALDAFLVASGAKVIHKQYQLAIIR